jgi:hypothetical protein
MKQGGDSDSRRGEVVGWEGRVGKDASFKPTMAMHQPRAKQFEQGACLRVGYSRLQNLGRGRFFRPKLAKFDGPGVNRERLLAGTLCALYIAQIFMVLHDFMLNR